MTQKSGSTALFGGSFDPPHLGHRRIIEAALKLPEIRRVLVVPAWLNPFKSTSHASAQQRLEWCRKVFDIEGVEVSDYEIRQQRPVYTVETWRALDPLYGIGALIVGSDNLPDLPRWKEFETLNRHLTWIIATRDGVPTKMPGLRRYRILEVSVPVSSTMIRRGEGLEFVDPRIRAEVEACYMKKASKESL